MKLLTREEFRKQTFARDNNLCVICGSPGQDSHHIIERRLWSDGGYYLENGATLCGDCHIKAEETTISCDEIRRKAGIIKIVLPEDMYSDVNWDKWGNPILSNNRKLKGKLFFDESVQKILKQGGVLDMFDDYVKYPKTMHVPWSNTSDDDKFIESMNILVNEDIVVTEKIDGENSNIYSDGYYHSRSLDGRGGEDRSIVAAITDCVQYDLPRNWRICGENVTARHSIHYHNLETFFMVFSIWDENNNALSWDETEEWCKLLNLQTVPVLYKGKYDEEKLKSLFTPIKENGDEMEGYVLRVTRSFHFSEFSSCIAKFVREHHVRTDKHWRYQALVKNQLSIN